MLGGFRVVDVFNYDLEMGVFCEGECDWKFVKNDGEMVFDFKVNFLNENEVCEEIFVVERILLKVGLNLK